LAYIESIRHTLKVQQGNMIETALQRSVRRRSLSLPVHAFPVEVDDGAGAEYWSHVLPLHAVALVARYKSLHTPCPAHTEPLCKHSPAIPSGTKCQARSSASRGETAGTCQMMPPLMADPPRRAPRPEDGVLLSSQFVQQLWMRPPSFRVVAGRCRGGSRR
jgi:hypothetical protein